MKPVRLILLGAALGLVSQAALAFQETNGNAAQPEAATKPTLQSNGSEIRVPGLGAIGTLPKLDFGLELLYGASEPRGMREELKTEPSDLQIRGTVKYKFGN